MGAVIQFNLIFYSCALGYLLPVYSNKKKFHLVPQKQNKTKPKKNNNNNKNHKSTKMLQRRLFLLFAVLLVVVVVVGAQEDQGCTTTPPAHQQTYWHNWADSEGYSHLTECHFTNWTLQPFINNLLPLYVDTSMASSPADLVLLQIPAHWTGPYHTNPVPQILVFLSGVLFFQASDNTTHIFTKGDVYFGEDQLSNGHLAEPLGNEPVIAAVIQYKEWQPTVNMPCRLH